MIDDTEQHPMVLQSPRLLVANARTHLDPEGWIDPSQDVDADLMGHGMESPPVAERQTAIRGLFTARYASVVPSPNYSSRNGRKIRVGIWHTAETGNADGDNGSAVNVAEWFSRPEAKSSSHAVADADRLVRGVPCALASWTCRGANSIAVQLEMATRAKRTRAQWLADPGMLEMAAQWTAAEGDEHGIPFVLLSPQDYLLGRSGFMDHNTYTQATKDGSHWDCGSGFPAQMVLDRAKAISRANSAATPAVPAPTPSTPTEEAEDWFDMFNSKEELRAFILDVVTQANTDTNRTEGISGAGDLTRLSYSVIPQVKRVVGEELDERGLSGKA